MLARVLTIAASALLLAGVPVDAGANDTDTVGSVDCKLVTVRLEPLREAPNAPALPHEYMLRTTPSAPDCSWTRGGVFAPQRLSATLSIADVLRSNEQCTTAACWPVLCRGSLADAKLDLHVAENGGLGRKTTFKAARIVRVDHLDPGFGLPTALTVVGHDTQWGIVAVSGAFVRSGGDCRHGQSDGWVEFTGTIAAVDPILPE